MPDAVDADYLVVGAGAMGMAFVDALVDHSEASVALVDRRHAPGGHWLGAYPFVRLHQASALYGVASTLLGEGRLQERGPEAGLQERATAPEIQAYYRRVLDRHEASGRVRFFPGCEYTGGTTFRSLVSGRSTTAAGARLVDATTFAGSIPSESPPPFLVEPGARVVPVGELARLTHAPRRFVVAGAGKTAMDACVWLLQQGVDPGAITWVRPRDAWMLDRAVIQPDPAIFLGMAADTMEAAAEATSPDDVFLRLEERGVMVRIDRDVVPTMAKTPTIARWEVDLLCTITDVVRRGHLRAVAPGRLRFADGDLRIDDDALVVHCAAPGLPRAYAPVPIWQPDAIRPQSPRIGFPCLGGAICGYVEATRQDDAGKNAICIPTPYANTPVDWLAMQVAGSESSRALGAARDVRAWADTTALNPGRILPDRADDPAVVAAVARMRQAMGPGRARIAALHAEYA
ncbi:NAD(P)-binding protein [Agromyces sp. SYSU T00194]|uniref:NAD(P)-binding protein n=1 Tax=Agromyces chitinivorans TaxID=3158560 RepID=UPI0033928776